MRFRGLAFVAFTVLFAGAVAAAPGDQPDIEMDPDQVGSGSGSATVEMPPVDPNAPVTKDPKVAKRWLAAAQQLVQKGDYFTSHGKPADAKAQYDNARTAFQKAIEAGDDVSINYSLALVEDKLGATPDAVRHLKLASTGQGVKPDLQKKAAAKLDELSSKVGLVTLQVKPDGTSISISGKPYGESPLAEPVVLLPGTYTATFTAAGYQPKDTELKVEAGSESERKIELEPVPIKIKPHIEEPEPTPETPPAPSLVPIYIGGGATAVFLLTATITGISAISQHHAFTDPTFTPQERMDAQSTGRTLARVTDVCIVGALGAAAFTAYWYQYKYRPALNAPPPGPERRDVPKVDVVPWVQPDGGGFVVAGSY